MILSGKVGQNVGCRRGKQDEKDTWSDLVNSPEILTGKKLLFFLWKGVAESKGAGARRGRG